jgi:molybdopterin converting factor small subunit
MVSKNNTYTTFDEKIEDGDTITISPPVVSGG